jgi:hypothetical protein
VDEARQRTDERRDDEVAQHGDAARVEAAAVHDQHAAAVQASGVDQEAAQRRLGGRRRHAVQVEGVLDADAAGAQLGDLRVADAGRAGGDDLAGALDGELGHRRRLGLAQRRRRARGGGRQARRRRRQRNPIAQRHRAGHGVHEQVLLLGSQHRPRLATGLRGAGHESIFKHCRAVRQEMVVWEFMPHRWGMFPRSTDRAPVAANGNTRS